VESGQVAGYLGANGSGKSTTVKMLAGLVEPDQGRIYFDGIDARKDAIAFKRRLGYVPEEAYVYSALSGMEYLELVGRLHSIDERIIQKRASDLLSLLSLYRIGDAPLSSYSKGMKQRVLIASALLHNPDLLIFDEPLSGLDVSSAILFRNLLIELALQKKAVLYISHILEAVEKICAKVIVIYKGVIVAQDSIEHLRELMRMSSLEGIFAQLVQ
jgi:ABC-2 type transport system ATP-binding protein